MELKNFYAQDVNGNIVPGAACTVYLEDRVTLATGLKDAAGAALTNPFTADVNGLAQFAAPNGKYYFRCVAGLLDSQIAVQFADPSEIYPLITQAQAAATSASADAATASAAAALIQVTPAASKAPKSRANGFIDYGWLGPISNARPEDILKRSTLQPDYLYLKQFGAIGDGTSHPLSERFADLASAQAVYPRATALTDEIDWCAAYAAIDSSSKSIYAGDGTFVFNKGLLVKNKDKSFFGNGGRNSQFLFTGQGDGLRFEQNQAFDSNCIGIFVSTNLLNTGRGLSASYVGFTGTYERNRRYQVFAMCRVAGQDYFQHGWKINVELDEVTLPLVQDCQLIGRRDLSQPATGASQWWPWTTYNLNYTSSTNLEPTDGLFEDVLSNYAQYSFNIRGNLEGMRFHRCITVATQWGVYNDMRAVTGSPSINPWLHVVDSHFNCSAGAVYSTYCYEGFISRNLLYKFDQVDEAYTAITTSFGNNWKVSDNHVDGISGSTGLTTFMKCQQNNDSKIHDNHGNFLDQGVVVDGTGGISGVEIYNNKLKGRDGNEVTQALYTNAASPLQNPATIQGGIIAQDSNAAVVAIASGGFSTIASFSLDAYPVGAVFLITAICQVTKGSTAGTTKLYVEKTAGTGNVTYMNNATGMGVQNDLHAASANWQAGLSGIIKKTTAGSVTLKLAVSSGGSNASVAALDGQYVLTRIG